MLTNLVVYWMTSQLAPQVILDMLATVLRNVHYLGVCAWLICIAAKVIERIGLR